MTIKESIARLPADEQEWGRGNVTQAFEVQLGRIEVQAVQLLRELEGIVGLAASVEDRQFVETFLHRYDALLQYLAENMADLRLRLDRAAV